MEGWAAELESGKPDAAWDLFLDRYRRLIFAAIRHYAQDHDDVMDVFARVCEALREDDLRRLRAFATQQGHRARFSTWLVTVVRHLTVDWFRHRDGRRRLSAVASALPALRRRIFEHVFLDQRSHIEAYELIRAGEAPTLSFRGFLAELRATYLAVTDGRRGHVLGELGAPMPPEVVDETIPPEDAGDARRLLARSHGAGSGAAAPGHLPALPRHRGLGRQEPRGPCRDARAGGGRGSRSAPLVADRAARRRRGDSSRPRVAALGRRRPRATPRSFAAGCATRPVIACRHSGAGGRIALVVAGRRRPLPRRLVRRRRASAVRGAGRGHERLPPRFGHARARATLSVEGRGTYRGGPVVGVRPGPVLHCPRRPAVTAVLGPSLLLAALVTQSSGADSLRLLALRIPESQLVLEVRSHPLAVREAITQVLARGDLPAAQGLAAAYATAWSDSFLVREVARFVGWPPDRRAAKVWADSLRRAGVAAYGRAGPEAAMAIWRRALSRAVGISDTAGIAAVLGNLGAGFLREGRLDSATVYLERSRALAAAVGDIRVEANAVGTLAGARADRGDLAAARDGYARALSLRERIGDSRGVAADHNNLGLLAQTTGDADEARRQFEAALDLNRRDGRDEVAATNLVNLAALAAAIGDFAPAEALYHDALATWRVREQWADAADALRGLGELELRRGDYPAARTALQEAVAIYGRTGPLADALAVRRELASALAAAGELQAALDQLRRAQRLAG